MCFPHPLTPHSPFEPVKSEHIIVGASRRRVFSALEACTLAMEFPDVGLFHALFMMDP